MRAHLAGTETFVHNQIVTLRRYRPVVVAHHRRPARHFPLGEGVIARERLPAPLARLDALAYRVAKVGLPQATATLADYLREQGARLLHYHFLTDARFLLGLQRRLDLPAIASGYGWDVSSFPRQWYGLGRRLLRPVFDRLDGVLAMSEDMRRDLVALGCPEDKVTVHYYGSDTARFRHPARVYDHPGPLTVLMAGRLIPRKGQHLVLRALRRLERRGLDGVRVVIVGEGPLRGELERLVAQYGWGGRVTLTGHLPYGGEALGDHLRDADVFALPSTTSADGGKEGIPGTIVEAMAAGLPVVSTVHAGIPAVIESGRDGLLVAEGDVDALAGALEAVLTDADLRARVGRAAAARAAGELDLRVRTAALERIYDRLLA